ncbi:MAG: 23S rRNA (adenine(2030)-N(6))-methyltransferase RlmJ [Rhodobacteraceae bacterium]|nr:23S rRNA (adenine(2030)-N(6))-methyltransferase RlmJ [Paracoccaceae bacterium]
MLSYQHLYHAGNAADVHKHALLAAALALMTARPKPLSYIETHAGRGLYDLAAPEALKTGEAAQGIGRLEAGLPADHPLRLALGRVRAAHGPAAYPGSPLVAAALLRPGDRMQLAELHPQEHAALQQAMRGTGAVLRRQDGFALALSLVPPVPRRGFMLIDPSFEVKADYDRLPRLVAQVHAKWNVGVLMLWYPLLADDRHGPMLAALAGLGLPRTLRHEVRFPPARPGHGMTGSGVFFVNAPHGLEAEAGRIASLFAGAGGREGPPAGAAPAARPGPALPRPPVRPRPRRGPSAP